MKTHFFTRLLIVIGLMFLCNQLFSQGKPKLDNYYDFYSEGEGLRGVMLRTMWLDKATITSVVREEMEKMGFERLSDHRIIKIDSGVYVVANCYSEKEQFGFVYEGSHGMFPNKENRALKSLNKSINGFDYTEKIVDIHGESEFLKIKTLPSNLFILKSDIYWYQETENPKDNKSLVTKEIIIKILRKDIQGVLKLKRRK